MVYFHQRDRFRRSYVQQETTGLIRDAYAKALREGHSVEEASKIANTVGKQVIADQAKVDVEHRQEDLAAKASVPDSQRRNDGAIPENWQELPWPQLRDLASRIAGHPIASRESAKAAISARLAGS